MQRREQVSLALFFGIDELFEEGEHRAAFLYHFFARFFDDSFVDYRDVPFFGEPLDPFHHHASRE